MQWGEIDRTFYKEKEGAWFLLSGRCRPISHLTNLFIFLTAILLATLLSLVEVDKVTYNYLAISILVLAGCVGYWFEAKVVARLRIRHFSDFLQFLQKKEISRELLQKAIKIKQSGDWTSAPVKEMKANNIIYLVGKDKTPALQRWVTELHDRAAEILEEYINGRTAKL